MPRNEEPIYRRGKYRLGWDRNAAGDLRSPYLTVFWYEPAARRERSRSTRTAEVEAAIMFLDRLYLADTTDVHGPFDRSRIGDRRGLEGRLLDAVCIEFLIARNNLTGPHRSALFVRARAGAAWVMRHVFGSSHADIAHALERSDHSSSPHWLRRAEELRVTDLRFRRRTDKLAAKAAAWIEEQEAAA